MEDPMGDGRWEIEDRGENTGKIGEMFNVE